MSAANNPYFSGDEDDDLFEDKSSSSSSGPTVEHIELIGPNTKLPKEIIEALKSLVDNPQGSMPKAVTLSTDMLGFFGNIFGGSKDGIILATLVDVVNRMTNGMVDQFRPVYEAAHEMILIESIRHYARAIHTRSLEGNGPVDPEQIELFLMTYIDYLDWVRAGAANRYMNACSDLGIEPDMELVEHGYISADDWVVRMAYQPAAIISDLRRDIGELPDTRGE